MTCSPGVLRKAPQHREVTIELVGLAAGRQYDREPEVEAMEDAEVAATWARAVERATKYVETLPASTEYRVRRKRGNVKEIPERVIVSPSGLAIADSPRMCKEFASLQALMERFGLKKSDLRLEA